MKCSVASLPSSWTMYTLPPTLAATPVGKHTLVVFAVAANVRTREMGASVVSHK